MNLFLSARNLLSYYGRVTVAELVNFWLNRRRLKGAKDGGGADGKVEQKLPVEEIPLID